MATSALVADLVALCKTAREEEAQGKHMTTDCKLVVAGSTVYAHSALLTARSKFFQKAFVQGMSETSDKVLTLRHVISNVPKESVHALLMFIYTSDASEVSSADIAFGILELLGAEEGDFLELSDCSLLRATCGNVIVQAVQTEDLLQTLSRALSLGSSALSLRRDLIENVMLNMAELSESQAFAQLRETPELLCEILAMVGSCMTARPGWAPIVVVGRSPELDGWSLSSNSFDAGLANSADAVRSRDFGSGAAAYHDESEGATQVYLQCSFDSSVIVREIYLGIGPMGDDWNEDSLDGADIMYSTDGDTWSTVGIVRVPEINKLFKQSLPSPIAATHWRFCMSIGAIAISHLFFT
ncbi:unnamed protein product [Polarella glacialis]|uniref:BTB domain-containing protein n=1 Tax=Polarella glacialis TaxID=89957 RepID=A0A813DDW7_POLGL|nr:unnamed protein product [Polarella glacialis]